MSSDRVTWKEAAEELRVSTGTVQELAKRHRVASWGSKTPGKRPYRRGIYRSGLLHLRRITHIDPPYLDPRCFDRNNRRIA